MNVAAPPAMQPFITRTNNRLNGLEDTSSNLRYELSRKAAPDKSVFVDAPAYNPGAGTVGVVFPTDASVVHHNTTGLVEITVSATIRAANFGGAGVGVFFDELAPTIMNGAPKYGVSKRAEGVPETTTGASYTTVFSVRPGTRTYSLYYYASNPSAGQAAAIDLATLIVRSI